jgi:hypothetical protein
VGHCQHCCPVAIGLPFISRLYRLDAAGTKKGTVRRSGISAAVLIDSAPI